MMQVPGEGMPPRAKGGKPGNLMLELRVEQHPIFRRQGHHIHQDLDVDFVDMILGATLQ